MGFRKFTTNEYAELRRQHNIMALVGNGFDIQVTQKHKGRFSPRYAAFYHYLKARGVNVAKSVIVQEMESLRDLGRHDWSDLENAIDELLKSGSQTDEIYLATVKIQRAFSEYLELVAPPDLLARLGKESSSRSLAITSMSKFVSDLAETANFSGFRFPEKTNHYDLYNFLFVNFNYTPLLDDYLYLDPGQWEPRRYVSADRNFQFYPNPTGRQGGFGNSETVWSSYLRADVVHPHGQQSIPRSLLFGIDAPEGYDPGTDPGRRLMKPYWAMNDIEYGHLFVDVDLFIIFGCSLGGPDGWWWRHIIMGLDRELDSGQVASDVVIYWWSREGSATTVSMVIDRFFAGAGVGLDDPVRQRIRERIHVVVYSDDSEIVWLAT